MVEAVNQENYQVNTFLDLQKSLQAYLREAYDKDGVWKVAEKKRQLNNGLAQIAIETLSVRGKAFIALNGSEDEPIRYFEAPDDMIEPRRMFIDGFEYDGLEEDDYIDSIGYFQELPQGWPLGQGSGVTSADIISWSRAYYWDIGERNFLITPKITTTSTAMIWYSAMPKKLTEDEDVPNVHPGFAHLAAAWAAHKLLYKNEEQKDRGARALKDYRDGIMAFEKFKVKKTSNTTVTFKKDKKQFKRRKRSFSRRADLGRNFDL
jgi:hypothetical protein